MGALTRRRGTLLFCALAILAVFCLAAVPVGVREEVPGPEALALDPAGPALRAKMDETAAPYEDRVSAGTVYWGEVHVVRWRTPLGRGRAVYLVPYLVASVRDVGTAGSAGWSFRLAFLSCEYRDGALTEGRAPWVRRARLTVEADENTGFTRSPGDGGPLLRVELDRADRLETGGWAVETGVSTVDSAVSPNAPCAASVAWEGALAVRLGPAALRSAGFALAASVPYENNVK